MVNSTWTKNHVDAVLNYGSSDPVLSTIHSISASVSLNLWPFMRVATPPRNETRIVYPPCDTKQMSTFAFAGRERNILSLAQFRYEFDMALRRLC